MNGAIKLPPRVARKVVETDIVKETIARLSNIRGVRAARNNSGVLEDVRGIPVHFGLGTGSPDIVLIITIGGVESAVERWRDMPPVAFAFGVELKQPGRYANRNQKAWHAVSTRRGMRVAVSRSADESERAVISEIAHLTRWLESFRARG
jgi:hypothetical protein